MWPGALWRTTAPICTGFGLAVQSLKIFQICVGRREAPGSCHNGSLAALGPPRAAFLWICHRFCMPACPQKSSKSRLFSRRPHTVFISTVPSINTGLPLQEGSMFGNKSHCFGHAFQDSFKLHLFGSLAARGHQQVPVLNFL